MLRKILILLFLFFSAASVHAGSYENALKNNDYVFLYIYTNECGTCKSFNKVYQDIQRQNKDYAYVRVNANTSYGMELMYKFRGRYVPYILLTNAKTKKTVHINHSCVMSDICLLRAMKSFKG